MTYQQLKKLISKRIDELMDEIEKECKDDSYLTENGQLLDAFKFYLDLYESVCNYLNSD